MHANYQPKIWRDCIVDEFFVSTLEGHGWFVTDGETRATWMNCDPAPNEVYKCLIYRKTFAVFILILLLCTNIAQS